MTTRIPRAPWLSRRRVPLIAGIAAFLLLLGGGGAWAYWTTSVTATGTLSTKTVSVTQANFPSLSATYLPSSLTSTGSFTMTNTGALAGTVTAQITAAGALAAGLPVQAWTVASASACTAAATVPGSAVSGSWGSLTLSASAAAGASVYVCVRTTIPDWKPLAVAGGAQSTTPSVAVSLNADGWVATTTAATNTQQTAGMYPLTPNFFDPGKSRWFTIRAKAANGICLDVSSSAGAGGTVISWSCHNDSNQRWEFVPVSGTNQSLVTIRPRHAMGTRIDYSTTGVQQLQNYAAGDLTQQWYVQQFDASTYQLVNAATGMCLNLRSVQDGSNMSTVTCNTATARLTFTREPLTIGFNIVTGVATIGFGSDAPGVVRLQRQDGASWTTLTTTAADATSVTFNRSAITDNTTATFRIVNSAGDVLWDNLRFSRSGTAVATVSGIG